MPNERDSPDDLYPFARATVLQLMRQKELRWNSHKVEDAIQDLFLAGWQVWQETKNVGLAKNRMVSRSHNLLRDHKSEKKHEPPSASSLPTPAGRGGEARADRSVSPLDRADSRGDPAKVLLTQEHLDQLSERQRQITLLRMAGYENEEIATELGIGLRTVERELSKIREGFPDEIARRKRIKERKR